MTGCSLYLALAVLVATYAVAARHHHLTIKGEMPPVGGGPAEA